MDSNAKNDESNVPSAVKAQALALPLKNKEQLIPAKGTMVVIPMEIDIAGQPGKQLGIFKVSARNPGKLRFSAEFQGLAPAPRPDPPPVGAGKAIDLDVHSGAMGGGSRFTGSEPPTDTEDGE